MAPTHRLMRRREVLELLGVSHNTLYRWMDGAEQFPRPVKIGARATRWRSDEVEAWIARRAANAA